MQSKHFKRISNGFGTRSDEVNARLFYTSGVMLTAARWALEIWSALAAPVSGRYRSGDCVTEDPDSCDEKDLSVVSTGDVERAAEPLALELTSAASERQVIVESAEVVELIALRPNQHAAYVVVPGDMREQPELSDLEIAECVRGLRVIRGGLWLLGHFRFGV